MLQAVLAKTSRQFIILFQILAMSVAFMFAQSVGHCLLLIQTQNFIHSGISKRRKPA